MRTSLLVMALALTVVGLTQCQSDRPRGSSGPSGRGLPASTVDAADVEQMFRWHYDSHYASTGYSYAQYRPAYRYGFDLAANSRFENWPAAERAALQGWDSSRMGAWERYQDAVRYGWELRRRQP